MLKNWYTWPWRGRYRFLDIRETSVSMLAQPNSMSHQIYDHLLVVTHVVTIKFECSFYLRVVYLCEVWLMVGVQLMDMLLKPLLEIGNIILDIMVAKHRPTICLILIGIGVLGLVDIVSEVDIRWSIIRFFFLVLVDNLDSDDCFHDTLGLLRS